MKDTMKEFSRFSNEKGPHNMIGIGKTKLANCACRRSPVLEQTAQDVA